MLTQKTPTMVARQRGTPMVDNAASRSIAFIACAALVLGPPAARADETVRCDSPRHGYRYCRADTDNRVELTRQHSDARCRENHSWGYDRRGVWVDRGCSATFRVGKRSGGNDKAVAAGAAIAGVAIIAAIAASKKKQEDEDVASWAVGSFTGYDEFERANVELTILPGGAVSGRAGDNEFSGSYKDARLEAGRHVFKVERAGNGFSAVDERNPNHRVYFQRSGSGY